MTQTTNEVTAQAATERDALPMHGTRLIGTMTGKTPARALLRDGNGRIFSVSAGQDTRAGKVHAIGEDHVILRRRDRLHRLALAG
jgi:Tfp pilus assembly protein PilP